MNDYIYQKPEAARYNLSLILGSGVLVVEGDKHKQQVSISSHLLLEQKYLTRLLASNYGMVAKFSHPNLTLEFSSSCQNPAFGTAQIRELTEIFIEKSLQVSMTGRFRLVFIQVHHLAPRYLENGKPEGRRHRTHQRSFMVEQDDTRRYWPGWYDTF